MHTWKRPAPAAHLGLGLLYAVVLALSAGTLATGFGACERVVDFALIAVWVIALIAAVLAAAALERSATDGLTGLANRSRIRAASNRALARGARTGRHTAVLVIDMNKLTEVNDALGHGAGDLVLIAFAEVLRRCVPVSGLAARLDGDEFAAVLPDLDFPEQAYEVAGRLAAALAPIVIAGKLVTPAASIGVAVSAPGELTHDELVHRADQAMGRAKRRGPQTCWASWRESFEQDNPSAAV